LAGFNKVILVGNLTRNPELRYTPSGTPVASFGLATSRRFKQAEELKGNGVIIDGRLQQRRWETEDGQKRSKHEVVAQGVTFLPKRGETAGDSGGPHEEPSYEDEQS
jgi:single-strand DNA-binding protein